MAHKNYFGRCYVSTEREEAINYLFFMVANEELEMWERKVALQILDMMPKDLFTGFQRVKYARKRWRMI